jgi:hypothetical protein
MWGVLERPADYSRTGIPLARLSMPRLCEPFGSPFPAALGCMLPWSPQERWRVAARWAFGPPLPRRSGSRHGLATGARGMESDVLN